jgi:hypothetical protein
MHSLKHIFHAGGMLNQVRAHTRRLAATLFEFPLHQKRHLHDDFKHAIPFHDERGAKQSNALKQIFPGKKANP